MKQNYQPGDHLVVSKGLYTHHGIYVGSNQVIHYAGLSSCMEQGASKVQISDLDVFSGGLTTRIRLHDRATYPADEIVSRAYSRLSEDKYHAIFNNCEHFAHWCVEGESESAQVLDAASATTSGAIGAMAGRPVIQGVVSMVSGGASAGAIAGPAGAAIGAGIGLIGWGVYRILKH